MHKPSAGKR